MIKYINFVNSFLDTNQNADDIKRSEIIIINKIKELEAIQFKAKVCSFSFCKLDVLINKYKKDLDYILGFTFI